MENGLIENKINELAIVNEEKKELLIRGSEFTLVPYFPLTPAFIKQFVLNSAEYPSDEGKFIQASIEMRSRMNQLFQANYDYEKNRIEINKLELDIEEIQDDCSKSDKRKEVEIQEKMLELNLKRWSMRNIYENAESLFNEYKMWLETVTFFLAKLKERYPNAESWKDFDLNNARMIDIKAKMEQWKMLSSQGHQITPSQLNLLISEAIDNTSQNRR